MVDKSYIYDNIILRSQVILFAWIATSIGTAIFARTIF